MAGQAQAAAFREAIIADRYAASAALAAEEAARAAALALRPGRVQNMGPRFLRAASKARRTGSEYQQTIRADGAYGQMAGMASTAKYAAAAAHAARYAAKSRSRCRGIPRREAR